MTILKSAVRAAILGAISIAAFTAPAGAVGFRPGQYTVTLFSGPDHQALNPFCVTFVKTGGVVGFRSSGTWSVGDLIAGNYVADGKDLRWYGVRTGTQIALNFHTDLKSGKGGFDLWLFSDSPITADDDGTLTLTGGCG
jgi:hypothetical protein